jgi:hypothetical protein
VGDAELRHDVVVLSVELVAEVHATGEDLGRVVFCDDRGLIEHGSAILAHEWILISENLESIQADVAFADAFFSEDFQEHDGVSVA